MPFLRLKVISSPIYLFNVPQNFKALTRSRVCQLPLILFLSLCYFSLTIRRKARSNSSPSCFGWGISISFTWEHDIFAHFNGGIFRGSSEVRWTLKGKSFIMAQTLSGTPCELCCQPYFRTAAILKKILFFKYQFIQDPEFEIIVA